MAVEVGQTYPRNGVVMFEGHRVPSKTPLVEEMRRHRFVRIFVLMAAVLVTTSILVGMVSYSMPEPSYETVVVSRGDTLWTIARKVKPGTDPRKTIYQIKQINELDSVNLKPGQTLVIPM